MTDTSHRDVYKKSGGKLPVMELFGPTIQGEGSVAGLKSHFIRFGGCDYRCSWCDSMHAVDPVQVKAGAKWLMAHEIVDAIKALPLAEMVTLTGGNPCFWDLTEVVDLLRPSYGIAVETQGSIWQDWLLRCDNVTVSPKPPSSGMAGRLDEGILGKFVDELHSADSEVMMTFKFVIFNAEDYEWAKGIARLHPTVPLFLSAGTDVNYDTPQDHEHNVLFSYRRLAAMVLDDPEMQDVHVLPQLHVLLWPGEDKGR